MKSKYLLVTLIGFFISNTLVTASEFDNVASSSEDRIRVIADEFEDRYYQTQEEKERRRLKVEGRLAREAAERRAAIAALETEKRRKKKTVNILERKGLLHELCKFLKGIYIERNITGRKIR